MGQNVGRKSDKQGWALMDYVLLQKRMPGRLLDVCSVCNGEGRRIANFFGGSFMSVTMCTVQRVFTGTVHDAVFVCGACFTASLLEYSSIG